MILCFVAGLDRSIAHIASHFQIHYTSHVEYPFPPVGIVGAADGKNRRAFFFLPMPRACPVEPHVYSYASAEEIGFGCHGLVPWSFTFAAIKALNRKSRCHGLVPWSFTLAAM